MQLLLETIDQTPYLGKFSDVVAGIRKKLKIPGNPGPGEKDKK